MSPHRLALALALILPAVSLAATPTSQGPRLAVILVVDQLNYETMRAMRPHFGTTGIERLTSEGASFTQTHYSHASTYTGPGHACIASGAYANKHGIVANKYYDRAAGKVFTMLADAAHPVLDQKPGADDDSSPVNFIGETVGDRLRVATGMKAKVVAIATKDRAAVLLGGRLGSAYWMSEENGKMTTSTYYATERPAWLNAFNDKKIPDSWFGKTWERSLPEKDYEGQDDRPYESAKAIGRTFPHKLTDPSGKPGPDFYAAFTATPMANDLEVELAKAAVLAENLGQRGVTDLLALSFTANDLIGHAFGPESHEVQDAAVRVDRSIADLLAFLEKQVGGKHNLVVVFTADHGATPTPEYMASLGHPAGRIKKAAIEKAVNKALGERFGAGEWVLALEDPSVFLNEQLAIERKLDFATVQETAGAAALGIPGFAGYFTRTQLVGGTLPATPVAHAYQLSFYAPRSGDVLLLTQPFYFWGKYGEKDEGSTHGSPYRYDSHVPLVFWGAGVKPGVHRGWVDISDLAPTLAALLDIGAPAGADGRARAEVLK